MAIESKNLLMAVKAFSRANPLPLDASEVHDSLELAEQYAKSAKAYPGQTIKVLQNGRYETYVLNPHNGGLGLTLDKVGLDTSALKTYVQVVTELPATGEQGVVYIDGSLTGYIWNGSDWKTIFEQIRVNLGGMDPEHPDGMGTVQEAHEIINERLEALYGEISILTGDLTTKDSVDYKIAQAIANVDHLKREIVSELPRENIDPNTIYMVPMEDAPHTFDEYMYMGNGLETWELIGNTKVDLTNYVTKEEIENFVATEELDAAIEGLVSEGVLAETVKDFITLAALGEYAKIADIETVFATKQEIADFATKQEIADFATKQDLNGFATESYVQTQIANIQIPSLEGFATQEYVDTKINDIEIPSLDGYATEQWIRHQDYASKAWVTEQLINFDGNNDVDLSGYVSQQQFRDRIGSLGVYPTVVDYINAQTLNVVVFE